MVSIIPGTADHSGAFCGLRQGANDGVSFPKPEPVGVQMAEAIPYLNADLMRQSENSHLSAKGRNKGS
jgi:hypothetical protein